MVLHVPMAIRQGDQVVDWTIDQTILLPSRPLFRIIGHLDLQANSDMPITISNKDTDGFVILDAIHLVQLLGELPR